MQRIGIRREDKTKWEARAPLIPQHAGELVRAHDVPVTVQKSPQRVFAAEEYSAAGVTIADDLRDCDIILGVKEVPLTVFEPNKTYVFFSHTIKGQPYNMPMLRRMIEQRCNLIDYEKITDDQSRRLVFFGYHAGLAGMIDTFWALGQRWLAEGRETPFGKLLPANKYKNLAAAKAHLGEAAAAVADGALRGLGPLVVGVTGYGQVSRGAQEVLDVLRPRTLEPQALLRLSAADADGKVYKVVFKEEHIVRPVDPAATFQLQDYYRRPERYRGVFAEYIPHLTVMVNAIYWEPKYPRLVTLDDLRRLYGNDTPPRLKVIGDISCDVDGSVQATVRGTDPGNPIFVYDVDKREAVDGCVGRGPVIMAIEALPTELPRESSEAFSTALRPFMVGLAQADPSGELGDWNLPAPLKRAVILHKGQFTPAFAYLRDFIRQ
jgi:alpha-aminoadipic semialdehyde synthase